MNIFFTHPDIGHYIGLDRTDIPLVEPVLEVLTSPIFTGVPVYDTNISPIIYSDSIAPIEYIIVNHESLHIV